MMGHRRVTHACVESKSGKGSALTTERDHGLLQQGEFPGAKCPVIRCSPHRTATTAGQRAMTILICPRESCVEPSGAFLRTWPAGAQMPIGRSRSVVGMVRSRCRSGCPWSVCSSPVPCLHVVVLRRSEGEGYQSRRADPGMARPGHGAVIRLRRPTRTRPRLRSNPHRRPPDGAGRPVLMCRTVNSWLT